MIIKITNEEFKLIIDALNKSNFSNSKNINDLVLRLQKEKEEVDKLDLGIC